MIEADLGGDSEYEPDDDLPDIAGVSDADLSAFGKKNPDLESLIDKRIAEEKRKLAATQKSQRLAMRRQHQDETYQRRVQAKLDKRAATNRRIGIRSSAISQRIQSYSIASSLGFAGYVAASIVDQFVIRPKENADIAAEDKYNADYAAYQQALEKDQVDRRRAEEDRISGMTVDEAGITRQVTTDNYVPPTPDTLQGPLTAKYRKHVEDNLRRTDLDPGERAYYERKAASFPAKPTLDADPRYTSRERPERTRSKEFLDTDEELDENGVPISSSRSKGAGPNVFNAARNIPDIAKAIEPIAPKAAVSFLEKAGPIGLAIAAGVTASQLANQQISKLGDATSRLGKDVFTGTVTGSLKDAARFAQGGMDPLGTNIPLQVAVTGFDVLLSLTESIKSYAERDKEFSPLTMQASIEGDIARLMQSIELANKNDPLKASFTEAMTRLDLVWNEFKAEAFQKLGPAVIVSLKALAGFIQGNLGIGSAIYNAAKYTPNALGLLINAVDLLAQAMAKDPIAGKLFDQLSDFMDPNNDADIPARAFNKKMPNVVP